MRILLSSPAATSSFYGWSNQRSVDRTACISSCQVLLQTVGAPKHDQNTLSFIIRISSLFASLMRSAFATGFSPLCPLLNLAAHSANFIPKQKWATWQQNGPFEWKLEEFFTCSVQSSTIAMLVADPSTIWCQDKIHPIISTCHSWNFLLRWFRHPILVQAPAPQPYKVFFRQPAYELGYPESTCTSTWI